MELAALKQSGVDWFQTKFKAFKGFRKESKLHWERRSKRRTWEVLGAD